MDQDNLFSKINKVNHFFDFFNSLIITIVIYILSFFSVLITLTTIVILPIVYPILGFLPIILGVIFYVIHLVIRNKFPEKDVLFSQAFDIKYKNIYIPKLINTLLYLPLCFTFAEYLIYLIQPQFAHGTLAALFDEMPKALGGVVALYVFGYTGLYILFRTLEFIISKDFFKYAIPNEQSRITLYTLPTLVAALALSDIIINQLEQYSFIIGMFLIGSTFLFLFKLIFIGFENKTEILSLPEISDDIEKIVNKREKTN